jgi:hypothetical protein
MYVKRNIEARSRNHCCRGKAISAYIFCVCVCVCMYVALVIQHALRMLRIVTPSLCDYHIFPLYLINGTIFGNICWT